MKVKLLNKILTSDRVYGLIFTFPPIAIPITDSGKITSPEDASCTHYSTIVLVDDMDAEPFIFEFPQQVFDHLIAYAKRHHGLHELEILASRDTGTNEIRLRTGKTLNKEETEMLASPHNSLYEQLPAAYQKRLGATISDHSRR